jgi:signal transduction histidine kinase
VRTLALGRRVGGVNRAIVLLAIGAFLALLIGVLAAGGPVEVVVLGAVFTLVGTAGFAWVARRERIGWAVCYVAVQLPLAFMTFVLDPGTGATLLLVVLVCQCVLLLPLPATALVIASVPFVHSGMAWGEAVREGFGTLVSVLFGAVVVEVLRREQAARTELAVAHERLRDHAAQAEQLATAQERNRVARDIHDGLGHSLTVVQMQVKAARAVLPVDPVQADAVLVKAQVQAEEALVEVRRSVSALREPRPPAPLSERLRTLAEESSAAGVPARLSVTGAERPLGEEAREAVFRAAQEGLTNVRKHARAARAEVVLDYADDDVRLEVRDDGVGADHAAPSDGAADGSGFGLLGLRERVEGVGGTVVVGSVPGGGYAVRLEIPG